MKRKEFYDFTNGNPLEVGIASSGKYISFMAEDIYESESVQISLSIDDTKRLIYYLVDLVSNKDDIK